MSVRLRLVSYNVHRCVGIDRRKDLGRVARVLAETEPDVVVVQEAEARRVAGTDTCQLEELGRRLGMSVVHGPTIVSHDGRYGNGLLSRFPVTSVERLDLSFRRREPRGALDVRLDVGGQPLRVVGTHLGLRSSERIAQLARLVEALEREPAPTTALLGDFNEWLPGSRVLAPLRARFGPSPRLATFPSVQPLMPLDRAFVAPRECLRELAAHRSALARMASDHLPLKVVIDLPALELSPVGLSA